MQYLVNIFAFFVNHCLSFPSNCFMDIVNYDENDEIGR